MKQRRTRIDAVMDAIRAKIASRTYLPGMRLPSVRAQAKAMGLSVSTVVEAYERLVAEGAITSRPGSGFYVASQMAPFSLAEAGPRRDRAVDQVWDARAVVTAHHARADAGGQDVAEALAKMVKIRKRLTCGCIHSDHVRSPQKTFGDPCATADPQSTGSPMRPTALPSA